MAAVTTGGKDGYQNEEADKDETRAALEEGRTGVGYGSVYSRPGEPEGNRSRQKNRDYITNQQDGKSRRDPTGVASDGVRPTIAKERSTLKGRVREYPGLARARLSRRHGYGLQLVIAAIRSQNPSRQPDRL
jgi:hypothetical protein